MKYLLIFSIYFFTNTINAQNAYSEVIADKVDINQLENVQYIQLLGSDVGLFKKKITIQIDYGQGGKTLKDEFDDVIKFKSMMGAFNYLVNRGWTWKDSYAFASGNNNVYHYTFERKPDNNNNLKSEEELKQ